jgi:formylglycine-generating enzyme required for sulfatase activity
MRKHSGYIIFLIMVNILLAGCGQSSTTLKSETTKVSEKDGMVMLYVPSGEFLMGSDTSDMEAVDDGKPQHTVFLEAYWIDQTEVTNGMYEKCVVDGGCSAPAASGSYTRSMYYGNSSYANYPVVNVSWYDAEKYCKWAGRKLPSEAQWEKAARGTEGWIYPWGNSDPTSSLLNYNSNEGDTTAVGSYPGGKSPYGALDMAGNVWEWVADWFGSDYYINSPLENPIGPSTGAYRVLRGGACGSDSRGVRAALRYADDPDLWGIIVGFRCAALP